MGEKKKKKKISFPTAFTICFVVIIIATVLTWVIPAGGYDTIEYSKDSGQFVVTSIKDGSKTNYPATQETLDKFHIGTQLESFLNGKINKPMSIMGTYSRIEQNPQGLTDFLKAPIQGTVGAVEIILFVFMIGGTVGILNALGVFNAGIASLAKRLKGREKLIIVLVVAIFMAGGTIFGFQEETIAFYPIIVPVFLSAGFDSMAAAGTILCGCTVGCMFSTTNPFAVVIGSYAAGITFTEGMIPRAIGLGLSFIITCAYMMRYAMKVKKDPSKSLCIENREELEKKYDISKLENVPEFTLRMKICLVIFALAFVVMVTGIVALDWSFTEMSVVFLVCGVLIGIVGGLKEKEIVSKFIGGAADLVGVALIIGVARGVSLVLEAGQVSGTILDSMSSAVSGLSPALFVILVMLLYIVLGLFINSSSGVALLSLPIMAPLADVVGVPREVVISAYIYGLNIIGFITPTGMALPSLEMAHVSYGKWLKFVFPYICIMTVLGAVMLLVQLYVFC